MFLFIYFISLIVVMFTIGGILVNNVTGVTADPEIDKRWAISMGFIILCPVINSFMACAIIVTAIWLLFFRHG